jgi:hypothetical protein
MTESLGLTVMITSGWAALFLPEVVPQPQRAATQVNAIKRSKYEGSMLNCLLFI